MFRRFGTVPFISECSLWVAPRLVIRNELNLKVVSSTRAWTSNEMKISVEAARLACPESKDEAHFLLLPLFVPTAEFDPADQSIGYGMSVRTEMLCDGKTRRTLANATEMFTKTWVFTWICTCACCSLLFCRVNYIFSQVVITSKRSHWSLTIQ